MPAVRIYPRYSSPTSPITVIRSRDCSVTAAILRMHEKRKEKQNTVMTVTTGWCVRWKYGSTVPERQRNRKFKLQGGEKERDAVVLSAKKAQKQFENDTKSEYSWHSICRPSYRQEWWRRMLCHRRKTQITDILPDVQAWLFLSASFTDRFQFTAVSLYDIQLSIFTLVCK